MSGFFGSSAGPFTIVARNYAAHVVNASVGGTLLNYTLPGGTLSARGLLWIRTLWALACPTGGGAAEAIQCNLTLGGDAFTHIQVVPPNSAGGAGSVTIDWYVTALDSTTAQASYGQYNSAFSEICVGSAGILTAPLAASNLLTVQFTKDFAGDVAFAITAPAGVGSITTTLTTLAYSVYRVQ